MEQAKKYAVKLQVYDKINKKYMNCIGCLVDINSQIYIAINEHSLFDTNGSNSCIKSDDIYTIE